MFMFYIASCKYARLIQKLIVVINRAPNMCLSAFLVASAGGVKFLV